MAAAEAFREGVDPISLVDRLKGVISQYSVDQILKELIQNADDAKAGTVKFMYDKSEYGQEGIVFPELSAHQGPALYAYNDAVFSDDDWNGIRKIQKSWKANDPMTTGCFGLGFKSVFHLTDFPGIISGSQVGFIDPLERYFTNDKTITDPKTGEEKKQFGSKTSSYGWKLSPDLLKKYPDQFQPFIHKSFHISEKTFSKGKYQGTCFRFPLRRCESDISDKIWEDINVQTLFKIFELESHHLLLFLKHVHTIELYEKKNIHGDPRLIQSISIVDEKKGNARYHRNEFEEKLACSRNSTDSPSKTVASYYMETKQMKENQVKIKKWLISLYHVGAEDVKLKKVKLEVTRLPLVGIALPFDEDCKGHTFCFLPLPFDDDNQTGLNFHVNGTFEVAHDRKHINWPSTVQTEADILNQCSVQSDIRNWNSYLVQVALPKAMLELVKFAIDFQRKHPIELRPEQVYNIFPNKQKVRNHWKYVSHLFEAEIKHQDCLFTSEETWCKPEDDVYFIDLIDDMYKESIRKILKVQRIPFVEPPQRIAKLLSHEGRQASQQVIRSALVENITMLSSENRKNIIVFFLQDGNVENVIGLSLLELCNGDIATFSTDGTDANRLYLESKDCVRTLLPKGYESCLVNCSIHDGHLYRSLQKVANSGKTQLRMLSHEDMPNILQRLLPNRTLYADSSQSFFDDPILWLQDFWNYLTLHHSTEEKLCKFEGIPIIPVTKSKWNILSKTQPYVFERTNEHSLADQGIDKSLLSKLGIIVVEYGSRILCGNFMILNQYISLPTTIGILDALLKIDKEDIVSRFCQLNEAEKKCLKDLLCKDTTIYEDKHVRLLEYLPLLKCYATVGDDDKIVEKWSSKMDVKYCAELDFPIPLPCKVAKGEECKTLANIISVQIDSETLILTEELFANIDSYSSENKCLLMKTVLNKLDTHIANDQTILVRIKEIPFIKTRQKGDLKRPCDVVDPQRENVTEIFRGLDIFPVGLFAKKKYLSKIQPIMKGISEVDIEAMAKYLNSRSGDEQYHMQAKKFFIFLTENSSLLTKNLCIKIDHLRWVPAKLERPSKLYPEKLKWVGKPGLLVTPSEITSSKFQYIAGAIKPVLPVPDDQIPPFLIAEFHWDIPPSVADVVSQLIMTTALFTSLEKKATKCENLTSIGMLVKEIYEHLHMCDANEVKSEISKCENWLWTGRTFTSQAHIVRETPAYNTEPYLYGIPNDMLDLWNKGFFSTFDIKEREKEERVLFMIQEYHNTNTSTEEERHRDLKMCIDILQAFKENNRNLQQEMPNIPIPVCTKDAFFKMAELQHCTFYDKDVLQKGIELLDVQDTLTDGEELYIIHENISPAIAKDIGVPSLMSRYLNAEELNIAYGQREELVERLNTLLQDYKDGSSIIKELLQNADDAGATEVCFFYDVRQFESSPENLFDPKMKELLGPALLCYNNATFTEDDFKNIVKLSGATKKEKTEKIGRFGLGFNAVYNLTDAPSFISGDSFVIFDPQVKYIGQAIRDKSNPGIRLNLKKHANKIRRLRDQFKPFQGIMNCDLQSAVESYNGTLFRFPLRTQSQAASSDISRKCYNETELKELFSLFQQNAKNLLLFTQNLQEVSFYVIDDTKTHEVGKIVKRPVHLLKSLKESDPYNVHNSVSTTQKDWHKEIAILKHCNQVATDNVQRNSFILEVNVRFANCVIFEEAIKDTSYWCISSVIGNESAKNIAQKHGDLLPVGGVAVELIKHETLYRIKSPEAINDGQIFCFFPLPIKNELPFHINGYFAVTPNRRQLCNKDLYDKEDPKALWNKALMKDAISKALAFLLYDLVKHPDLIHSVDLQKEIFHLFPTAIQPKIEGKQNLVFSFVKSFYEYVVNNKMMEILPSMSLKWTNFISCRYLDPLMTVSHSLNFGNVSEAFVKVCQRHVNGCTGIFVNIKETVVTQIKAVLPVQQMFYGRVIKVEEFYDKIFLPNIQCEDTTTRDMLMFHAILECDNDSIDSSIQRIPCIPVTSAQKFLKPSQIINPYGPLEYLFDTSNGPIPVWLMMEYNDKFVKPDLQKRLCMSLEKLGMRHDTLENTEVIERAHTIISLSKEQGHSRCMALLDALARKMLCTERETFLVMAQQLETVKFLPLLEKPKKWVLPWQNEIEVENFVSIKGSYTEDQKTLVGSSEIIAKFPYDSVDLKTLLGYTVKSVSLQQIDIQLSHIIDYVQDMSVPNCENTVRQMMDAIYRQLNNMSKDSKIAGEIKAKFKQRPLIFHFGKSKSILFVCPSNCALEAPNCEPYMYELPATFSTNYKDLLSALDIRNKLDCHQYINMLQKLNQDKNMTERTLDAVLNIVQYFAKHVRSNQIDISEEVTKHGDIYLPNNSGYMVKAKKLSFNNCPWIKNVESNFLQERLCWEDAEALGVKNACAEVLSNFQHGIPFGQQEKLTNRIKRILEGYPFDKEILNELLQNADDAGASEIHFILDKRSHPKDKIFCKEWEALQGPALLVYNDKPFTAKDLEGIKNLGEGGKANDPLKAGKYGVGFNCVYHLTDTPTFLTTTEEESEQLLVAFDPLCEYVPLSEKHEPGQKWTKVQKLEPMFPDVFNCYHLPEPVEMENSTLFRFPLRTVASEISENVVTVGDIKKLFSVFFGHMAECLLFLGNVEKITISEIDADGSMRKLDEVCVNIRKKDSDQKSKFLKTLKSSASEVKESGLTNVNFYQYVYQIETENAFGDIDKWMIVQQTGFRYPENVDLKIIQGYAKKGASLIPRGGVAYRISTQKRHEDDTSCANGSAHKLFCLLPLPIETDFPMHLNGYFALDHESRRNIWTDENETSFNTLWNKMVLQEIVADCYVTAMVRIKDKSPKTTQLGKAEREIKTFNKLFPDTNIEYPFMHFLEKSIYQKMIQMKSTLLPVFQRIDIWKKHVQNENKLESVDIKWHAITTSSNSKEITYFDNLDDQIVQDVSKLKKDEILKVEYLRNVLGNIRFPTTYLQNFVLEKIEDYSDAQVSTKIIAPEYILQFLRETIDCVRVPILLAESPFIDFKALSIVFKYCKLHVKDYLDGLPMLLDNRGVLLKFDKTTPLFITAFSDLISSKPELFASWLYLGYLSLEETGCLKKMTCKELEHILQHKLNSEKFKGKEKWVEVDPSDKLLIPWLNRLWNFIHSESWVENEKEEKKFNIASVKTFDDWCILPVKSSKYELFPVSRAAGLVNLSNDDSKRTEVKILRKVNFPEPILERSSIMTDVGFSRIMKQLTANLSQPCGVLHALLESIDYKTVSFACLFSDECKALLQYFCSSLKELESKLPNAQHLLKKLPFYELKDGTTRAIHAFPDSVFVVPNQIPKHGSEIWFKSNSKIYIYKHHQLKTLYEFLGIKYLTVEEMYISHILPSFSDVGEKERFEHLKFLKAAIDDDSKGENVQLKQTLSNTPILFGSAGNLQEARKFFDPKVKIFRLMETNFPPDPFSDQYRWIPFLKYIGLQDKVTPDLALKYARRIAEDRLRAVSEDEITQSVENSKLLCETLFEEENIHLLCTFCNDLKNIRFLPMEPISANLYDLHPPYPGNNAFICWNKSAIKKLERVFWSCCPILPEWAVDSKHFPFEKLGVICKPTTTLVIKSMESICHWHLGQEIIDNNLYKMIKNFVKVIFQLVQNMSPTDSKFLQQLECIPIESKAMLVKPRQISFKLHEDIAPYLCRVPSLLVEFREILLEIGTTEEATCQQYAFVLQRLFQLSKQSGSAKMNVNEVNASFSALHGFFHHFNPKPEVQELYFLTDQQQILKSNEVIINDKPNYSGRIDKLSLPFMVKVPGIQLVPIINKLPKETKPILLSDLVKEELEDDASSFSKTTRCIELEERLSSDIFINGIIRLLRSIQDKDDDKKEQVDKDDKNNRKLAKKLQNVKFMENRIVRTSLLLKDVKLKDSTKVQPFFITKDGDGKRTVYLSSSFKSKILLNAELCNIIDIMMMSKTKTFGRILHVMLDCPIEDIPPTLSILGIAEYSTDYAATNTEILPKPGDYIPIENHHFLEDSMVLLSIGEYVGYEIYDELDNPDCDTDPNQTPVIIYAKIVTILTADDEENLYQNYRYVIQIQNCEYIEVHASKLHRINRKQFSDNVSDLVPSANNTRSVFHSSSSTETSSVDISQEKEIIKRILQNAMNLSENDRRSVIKRIMFRWHPDKNPDCVVAATELFQYIQYEISSGMRSDPDIYPYAKRFESTFRNRAKAQSCYRNTHPNTEIHENEGNSGRSYGNYSTRGTHTRQNPQQTEAKRWIQQAKYDLEAVPNEKFYEWECFKSHKAAEKALKATLIAVDTTLYKNVKDEDSLEALCEALDDTECKQTVNNLQSLIGGCSKMLYPGLNCSHRTPHDDYTSEQAKQAKIYATAIVKKCEEFIQRKRNN